ncbi:MAG TPA: sigma-70 family RNA polymerase sigma factor [Candidatus Eisenbacteria bacterium]
MPATPDPLAPGDASLVGAARRGDRAAFGALYRRHARLVQAVLLARVAPDGPVGIDDLVQEVFLTAMHRLHSLRDDHAFAPWLATIARRRAADWRRRRRDTVEWEEVLEGATPPDDDAATAREAVAAIASLPAAYRETLMLRFVAGLTGPEIAERTGLTHGSVRVNLHRGVTLLRERLKGGGEHA